MRLWLAKKILPRRYHVIRAPEDWVNGDFLHVLWLKKNGFSLTNLRAKLRASEDEIRRAMNAEQRRETNFGGR